MISNGILVEILVDSMPITEYEHESHTYVEGREGKNFTLRITNNNNHRVLAIPSVDGMSVLDGKPASHDSMGYVISAHSSVSIPGWTLDNNQVAKFFFTQKEEAYATRIGSGTQTGVIGVIAYKEQVVLTRRVPYDYYVKDGFKSANNSVFGSSTASACLNATSSFDMGTGFGEKTEFKTNKTEFNRGDFLTGITVYYDSKRNLEKRGIKFPVISTRYNNLPDAFPGIGCTPPPNWKG